MQETSTSYQQSMLDVFSGTWGRRGFSINPQIEKKKKNIFAIDSSYAFMRRFKNAIFCYILQLAMDKTHFASAGHMTLAMLQCRIVTISRLHFCSSTFSLNCFELVQMYPHQSASFQEKDAGAAIVLKAILHTILQKSVLKTGLLLW